MNVKAIGDYMELQMRECDDCPLEKICDEPCEKMWAKFMGMKVCEKDIITEI